MFHINKHPAGKVWNFLFALAQLVDGLVRTLTLGTVFTRLPTIASRKAVEAHLRNLKKQPKNT